MKHKTKIFSLLLVGAALLLGSCDMGLSVGPGSTGNTGDTGNNEPHDTPEGTYTIDLYANGDQHGVLEKGSNYVSYPTYITYIKNQMERCTNPVLISNGDLWQGTYESNIYQGEILTELLDVAGYSAFTLGNHEFDWGQDIIRQNAKLTKVPFLGCNIQYYDANKQKATGELVDYVEPYTVVDTPSGIRVGIIGAINPDQWSSITSSYVQDIDFVDPVDPMMEYSDILRLDEGCEVIVASFHAGTDDAEDYIYALSETSKKTGLPYIDAAFTSHDHTPAYGYISGVPYANSGTKNAYLSHIQLTVTDGVVTSSKAENLNTGSLNSTIYPEDAEARNYIDNRLTDADKAKGSEVEGKLGSNFYRYCSNGEYGPRLAARSMYEYCKEEGYGDITCAFVNDTRAVISSGNVTYANILEAVPFSNKVVIMKVSGSVLQNELRYAYGGTGTYGASVMYYAPSSATINSSKTYTIAAYDYLAYHMNATTRAYNYFSSFAVVTELDLEPADYIANYMNTFGSTTIRESNFPDSDFTCLS